MKEFKTIDEQIEVLKKRGLIIEDEERAKKYLLSQNYYNLINGYAKFFPRENDVYIAQTTFDEITNLYVFERDFKQAMLSSILEAEKHIRAIFSYRFSEMYKNEPYAYLNINCYDKNKILMATKVISNLSQTVISHSNKKNKNSIAHYVKKHKHVPIWVLVNYISFGELKRLLSLTTKKLQNKVSKDFLEFINQNIPDTTEPFHPENLSSFLDNMNEFRNICAHNNRILGFRCRQNTKYWNPLHSKYNISQDDNRRSAYEVFVSLQCFLSKNEYAILHNTLRKRFGVLSNKLKTISINDVLDELGFPKDWNTVEKLEQK